MRDAVRAADRLHARLAGEIDGALAAASHPPGAIHVTWAAALDAAACAARYRGLGEAGWGFPGWEPATAGAAIGRAALDHHLAAAGDTAVALPSPVEAVRKWIRDAATAGAPGVAGWVGDLRAGGERATLAAAAAAGARWLSGFVRVLGWPLPPGTALLGVTREGMPGAKWWPRQASPVSVGSGADARIGRVTGAGDHVLVVHRVAAPDDPDLLRRAAVEAAAGALVHRVAPDSILVTAGDTGERAPVAVDEALLDTGGDLLAAVVRQRVIAVDVGFDPADATPSGLCRRCPHAPDCRPGRGWLAGPGRWRGGLPALEPDPPPEAAPAATDES
ncbi:MAG TPA: hypothetical protein VFZ77_20995 [Acidimicrobiales bacterium]